MHNANFALAVFPFLNFYENQSTYRKVFLGVLRKMFVNTIKETYITVKNIGVERSEDE